MRFLLAATLAVWPLRATAVAYTELFDVDSSCNTNTIQGWVDDAGNLITAVNNFYQAARQGSAVGINRAARGYFQGLMNWDMPPAGQDTAETVIANSEPNVSASA